MRDFIVILQAFVLCRIYVKSRCGNSLSDHVLSSCAEESVSAVRHIGIQHDETVISDVVRAKACDDNSLGKEDDVLGFPMRVVQDIDDRITKGAVSVTRFEIPSDIHPTELVPCFKLFLCVIWGVGLLTDILHTLLAIIHGPLHELIVKVIFMVTTYNL